MSTAIALQNMSSDGEGAVRHRALAKSPTTESSETERRDSWVDTPHDIPAPVVVETRPFTPTNTYWITPHGLLTKNITILDLTNDIATEYTGLNDAYKAAVQKALKDHSHTPAWTCHRNNWLGLRYRITDSSSQLVAEWEHPWSSVGTATLTFPSSSSSLPSHPISLKPKRWGLRTEVFTLNSVPYIWEMDSVWHSTNMTLYKVFGSGENERREVVAKYAQKWWGGFVTGGTIVVDQRSGDAGHGVDGEVDMGVVACLTACVVLKKKRQRAAERKSGGE